jgi:hypothetical protein
MGTLLRDLRYGLRMMLGHPGFTLVAVVTMAIGIASTTTVFSWMDGLLLRPLRGVGEPERVVALETVTASGDHLLTSYPDYRDLRDHATLLDGLATVLPRPINIGEGARAERVWAELVSGNYFDVLRVKPLLGRFFEGAERDDAPGGKPVAVLSYGLWKSRFRGDPAILGKTIRINRLPYTILGVAPEISTSGTARRACSLAWRGSSRGSPWSRRATRFSRLRGAWRRRTRTPTPGSALRCCRCGSRPSARSTCFWRRSQS